MFKYGYRYEYYYESVDCIWVIYNKDGGGSGSGCRFLIKGPDSYNLKEFDEYFNKLNRKKKLEKICCAIVKNK